MRDTLKLRNGTYRYEKVSTNHSSVSKRFKRIQENLEGKKRRPPARADFNADFPLRGFVLCDCCGNAMTAAWSKGKYRHYAYYRCETRGCEAKSKSVPKAKMEEAFEGDHEEPCNLPRGLFDLAKAMLRDAWDMRLGLREQ